MIDPVLTVIPVVQAVPIEEEKPIETPTILPVNVSEPTPEIPAVEVPVVETL